MKTFYPDYSFNVGDDHSITADEIKKVQTRLLLMADAVIEILDKNDIPYIIAFGTLLGAVRHKGFIPWDDDFDLFIFDENYDDALRVLRNQLPSWMIVHDKEVDPIYWPFWSRVRDLRSEAVCELFPNDNKYKYHGINLDLYRLEHLERDCVSEHILRRKIEHYNNALKINNITKEQHEDLVPKLIKELNNVNLKQTKSKSEEKVYSFLDYCPEIREDIIFPLRRYSFEGRELWGPNCSKDILVQMYGESYMQPPPIEMRKPHYSRIVFFDEV